MEANAPYASCTTLSPVTGKGDDIHDFVCHSGGREAGTRNPWRRKGLTERWTPGSRQEARPGVTETAIREYLGWKG